MLARAGVGAIDPRRACSPAVLHITVVFNALILRLNWVPKAIQFFAPAQTTFALCVLLIARRTAERDARDPLNIDLSQ